MLTTKEVEEKIDLEQEDEFTPELPPPMKPLLNSTTIVNVQPVASVVDNNLSDRVSAIAIKSQETVTTDLSEIEQIVKEKMEQHERVSKCLERGDSTTTTSTTKQQSTPDHIYQNTAEASQQSSIISEQKEALNKRQFALKELVNTEKMYVEDLRLIVQGYMAEMRTPDSEIVIPDGLKGCKERMIFCNIEAIYEWHRE